MENSSDYYAVEHTHFCENTISNMVSLFCNKELYHF